jgi:hypothetical protein
VSVAGRRLDSLRSRERWTVATIAMVIGRCEPGLDRRAPVDASLGDPSEWKVTLPTAY